MRLTKIHLFITLTLIASSVSVAQDRIFKTSPDETCTMRAADLPVVRGFRLGQSYEEVISRFSKEVRLRDEPDDLGQQRLYLSSVDFTANDLDDFKKISSVELSFIDNSLFAILINYDESVKWKSDEDFKRAIVEYLKLPNQGWRGTDPTLLECGDFRIGTKGGRLSTPTLSIKQIGIDEEMGRRRRAKEEHKRQTFKP